MSSKTEDLSASHILAMNEKEMAIAVRNWAVSPVSCQDEKVDGAKVLLDQRMLDAFPWLKNASGLEWLPYDWRVIVNGTPTPRDNELLLFCQTVSSLGQKKMLNLEVAVLRHGERSSRRKTQGVEYLVVKGKEIPIAGTTVTIFRRESHIKLVWSMVPPTASFAVAPEDGWFNLKPFEMSQSL